MLRGLMPLAAGIAVAGVLSAVPAIHAQDAPAPVQRPADIRLGTCAALGEVVAPLSSVIVPAGDPQGQAGATPVEQSVTEIPMALNELLASGHAIAVHPSPEQTATPVACGEIGGALASDGTLAVGLNAMNASKLSGVAYFAPGGDGHATVVTLLVVDERAGRRLDDREGATATGNDSGGADDAGDGAPAPAPEPAPADPDILAPPPATAGLDGTTTISADGPGAKPGKGERDRDKDRAEPDEKASKDEDKDEGVASASDDREKADRKANSDKDTSASDADGAAHG